MDPVPSHDTAGRTFTSVAECFFYGCLAPLAASIPSHDPARKPRKRGRSNPSRSPGHLPHRHHRPGGTQAIANRHGRLVASLPVLRSSCQRWSGRQRRGECRRHALPPFNVPRFLFRGLRGRGRRDAGLRASEPILTAVTDERRKCKSRRESCLASLSLSLSVYLSL